MKILLFFLPILLQAKQYADSSISFSNHLMQTFKVNMFPMAGARVSFNYETQLNTKRLHNTSLQFEIDVLGAFNTNHNRFHETNGYAAHLMYKKYLSHDKTQLQGFYLSAKAGLGYMNFIDYYNYIDLANGKSYLQRRNFNNSFIVGFFGLGKQYVLHERFVLDFNAGVGLFFGKSNLLEYSNWTMSPVHSPFDYGIAQAPELPLAGTASIKLGYQFGTKR